MKSTSKTLDWMAVGLFFLALVAGVQTLSHAGKPKKPKPTPTATPAPTATPVPVDPELLAVYANTPRDASLVLMGSLDVGPDTRTEMEAKGPAVYIGGKPMLIVDASTPSAPQIHSIYAPGTPETNYTVTPMALRGNRMVTKNTSDSSQPNGQFYYNQAQFLDVSNPLSPVFQGWLHMNTGEYTVSHAAISPDTNHVVIQERLKPYGVYDVTNPASPTPLFIGLPSLPYRLWVDSLLLATNRNGLSDETYLAGINMAPLHLPTPEFKEYFSPSLDNDLYASDDLVFVFENDHAVATVLAISLRRSNSPRVVGKFHFFSEMWTGLSQIEGIENIVFVAHDEVIRVINFRSPAAPVLLESHDLGTHIHDIKYEAGLLFVLADGNTLIIFRVDTVN